MTTYVFISDLHLSEQYPCLVQGFFALLKHYQAYDHVKLYILGDWFNAWLGDDMQDAWIVEIIQQLQQFSQAGHHIYFQKGNRDFLLGNGFLKQFNGELLNDVDELNIAHYRIRIEHGDLLCTDDVQYQRFRKIIRSPMVLAILKHIPLAARYRIAQHFRKKSQAANQSKDWQIMNVNEHAVTSALQNYDLLIHGHTHRPQIHQINEKQQRIVLGDWRTKTDEHAAHAIILQFDDLGNYQFKRWEF
ncbi:MAG: UDP-2,3-diacylglucosamine diphosphatase [Acinetobacter sp.]|nr:UDP-2,3-diacylglucosamine diphosphatase [Acinetobacter sp.]